MTLDRYVWNAIAYLMRIFRCELLEKQSSVGSSGKKEENQVEMPLGYSQNFNSPSDYRVHPVIYSESSKLPRVRQTKILKWTRASHLTMAHCVRHSTNCCVEPKLHTHNMNNNSWTSWITLFCQITNLAFWLAAKASSQDDSCGFSKYQVVWTDTAKTLLPCGYRIFVPYGASMLLHVRGQTLLYLSSPSLLCSWAKS